MFSSVVQLCLTFCDPMNQNTQASLSITNCQSLPKPMSIESMMPSNHLILCCPLLLLPSIPMRWNWGGQLKLANWCGQLRIRWPKYWSFSFNISPSNEHPGLISFRMDWWILWQSKGLSRVFSNTTVQKHQFSAFFIFQLSHPYMTTGKTVALTRLTFAGKAMSLLF